MTTCHLHYYVAPASCTDVWRWNVEQLRRRIGLFNGRRLVAVATGGSITQTRDDGTRRAVPLEPIGAVAEALAGMDCEVIEFRHSPTLRESVAFTPLLERLRPRGPGEAIFRAHAKGVSHPKNPGVGVTRWTELLYEINLDYWPLVREHLKKYACTGAFQKVGSYFATPSVMHYAGSFYWLRSDALFARNWQCCRRNWYGVEPYPGEVFRLAESSCLFLQRPGVLDLYTPAGQRAIRLEAEYARWREANRRHYQPGGVPCSP